MMSRADYVFAKAAIMKYYKLDGSKPEMYGLRVL